MRKMVMQMLFEIHPGCVYLVAQLETGALLAFAGKNKRRILRAFITCFFASHFEIPPCLSFYGTYTRRLNVNQPAEVVKKDLRWYFKQNEVKKCPTICTHHIYVVLNGLSFD